MSIKGCVCNVLPGPRKVPRGKGCTVLFPKRGWRCVEGRHRRLFGGGNIDLDTWELQTVALQDSRDQIRVPFHPQDSTYGTPRVRTSWVPRLRIHIHIHLDLFFSRFGQGTIGGFKTKQLYLLQHFLGQVDYSMVFDWTRTKQKMAQIPGSTSLHSKNMF